MAPPWLGGGGEPARLALRITDDVPGTVGAPGAVACFHGGEPSGFGGTTVVYLLAGGEGGLVTTGL